MLTQEEIYQYSLARNEAALRPLLDNPINIDELLPIIKQLVYDNKHNAAIWLLKKLPLEDSHELIRELLEDLISKDLLHHAENIRIKYPISNVDIISIALFMGRFDYAARLIRIFHVSNHTINVIAFNTAQYGFPDASEWLRTNYDADILSIAAGAVFGAILIANETGEPNELNRQLLALPHVNINDIIIFLTKSGYGNAACYLYPKTRDLNFTEVAVTAITARDTALAEMLRFTYPVDINEMIITAFEVDLIGYAEWLLDTPNAHINIRNIANLAARKGLQHATQLLLNFFPIININAIAYAAAEAGQIAYTEWLRNEKNADASKIAAGAARGGHREYAELLRREHGANPSEIAAGAARGGHREHAEFLRREHNANPFLIAKNAVAGGYFDYAEELITIHPEAMNLIEIAVTAIINRHEESPSFTKKLLLRHLSSFASQEVRWDFLDLFIESLERHDCHYAHTPGQRDKLLLQAHQLYIIRERYDFSFEQALDWYTIREKFLPILLSTEKAYLDVKFPKASEYRRFLRHTFPRQMLFSASVIDNDALQKITNYWQKRRIIKAITDYCDRHLPTDILSRASRFFSSTQRTNEAPYLARKQAALALLEHPTSKEELVELINNELRLYIEEKGYEPDHIDPSDEYLSYLCRIERLLGQGLANDNGAAAPRINLAETEAITYRVRGV